MPNVSEKMKRHVLMMMKTNRIERLPDINSVKQIVESGFENNKKVSHRTNTVYDSCENSNDDTLVSYDGKEEVLDINKYKINAMSGNSEAQYYLGVCYEKGYGVNINILLAMDWYKKSAQQGNNQAKSNVERLLADSEFMKLHNKEIEDLDKIKKKQRKEGIKAKICLLLVLLFFVLFCIFVNICDH